MSHNTEREESTKNKLFYNLYSGNWMIGLLFMLVIVVVLYCIYKAFFSSPSAAGYIVTGSVTNVTPPSLPKSVLEQVSERLKQTTGIVSNVTPDFKSLIGSKWPDIRRVLEEI